MSEQTTPPSLPPSMLVMQLISGFQMSQAAYVIADTGVATILEQEGPQTVSDLAKRTGTHEQALGRLIRTLTAVGLFTTKDEKIWVTEAGALLSAKHPQSLAAATRMWMETHYLPFSELGHSVRTGHPGAEKYLGAPVMTWINQDEDRAKLFSQAMGNVTRGLRTGMFDGYCLPEGKVVADIGGSDGSVLVELLERDADPRRKGVVFDLPETAKTARPVLAAAGLSDRVDVVDGDFFDHVPGADIYILSYIFHDWSDDENLRILAAIRAAARPGARLLVIEGIVPEGDDPHLTKVVDLTMLGMLTGRERTLAEYRDLLQRGGFVLDRVVGTPSPFSILETTLR